MMSGARVLGVVALSLALTFAGGSKAVAGTGEVTVPVSLQIDLLSKVAAYDRNLGQRAGARVVSVVVTKAGNPDSVRMGAQARGALEGSTHIGGLPHHVEELAFKDAATLASLCRERRASIVYVSAGFRDDEIAAIVDGLKDVEALTVTAVPRFVQQGMVLGFDLVEGKPKLLFSLSGANRHRISLSANVLSLMTVLP